MEKWTFEQIAKKEQQMLEAKEQGKSLEQIAEMYGVQLGIKIVYVQLIKIKNRAKQSEAAWIKDTDSEEKRPTTFD